MIFAAAAITLSMLSLLAIQISRSPLFAFFRHCHVCRSISPDAFAVAAPPYDMIIFISFIIQLAATALFATTRSFLFLYMPA